MKQTRTMKTGIAILLTIALVATGMNVQTFLAKAAEEGNDTGTDSHTEQNIKYEKVDDIKPYRGEVKVAPSTGEGYLFAGWFTDETGQEALGESVTTGVAYAKFVPAHILDVKAQISGTVQKETNASTKTATLRFVTTVDSLKYRKVGFSYSVSEQQSLEYESKYVYTKLHYMGSDQQMEEYFPTEFCSMSQYFKAMTIAGIPESAFATKITIQSYWITQDGTKVLGGIKEVSVQDGLDASFDARISDTDKDTYYVTLGDAVTDAAENDTIEVIRNIELSEEIAIKKSLTITTDGKERTITLKPTDTASVDSRIFHVGESSGNKCEVVLKGASAKAPLILAGTGNEISNKKMLIYFDKSYGNAKMEYVTVQNANRGSNGAGAAIFHEKALTLNNCKFVDCQATYGGAIRGLGELIATGCSFENCRATSAASGNGGGAISNSDGNVMLTDCGFKSCNTSTIGGAIYRGGASKTFKLKGCTFEDNTAKNYGGAIHVASQNTVDIEDCTFAGNNANTSYGGAVSIGTGASVLNMAGNCIFKNNSAKGNTTHAGGAVLAPVNFNIKSGATVIMTGNECTGSGYGDAISINSDAAATVKFIIEENASLYVYDNPNETDDDNDICIKKGVAVEPTVSTGGTFRTDAPQ